MRLPISSSTRERVVQLALEGLGPDDPGGARLDQLDRTTMTRSAMRAHGAAGDIVDVQPAAGILRRDDSFPGQRSSPSRGTTKKSLSHGYDGR